jgi:hypothetical protein
VEQPFEDLDESLELESVEESTTDEVARARPFDADAILDTLVPQTIDWRDTVSRHPIGAVVCVGLVGYLVGRTKGSAIMAGMTAGLSSALTRQLSDVFDGDFFDF